MEVQSNATPDGAAGATDLSVVTVPEGTPDRTSVREAARILAGARIKKAQEAQQAATPQAPSEPVAEAAPEPEPQAAPLPEVTGSESVETQEAAPEPEAPIIEPPRSWSKEARSYWDTLAPETQSYLLEQDATNTKAVRNAQNEAANERKRLEAERQQAEQVRQQYENALPVLMQTLQAQVAGEFADIKSMEDVERMARDDWPRYIQWDAQQKKLAAVQQEMASAQQRHDADEANKWQEKASQEDRLFAEKVPDIADPQKGPKLRERAVKALTEELGFDNNELVEAWNRGWLRDHRAQMMLYYATQYLEGRDAAKKAPSKPVPPVTQRPGPAQGKNAEREMQLKNLAQKLEQTHSAKDAARFLVARRAAARR